MVEMGIMQQKQMAMAASEAVNAIYRDDWILAERIIKAVLASMREKIYAKINDLGWVDELMEAFEDRYGVPAFPTSFKESDVIIHRMRIAEWIENAGAGIEPFIFDMKEVPFGIPRSLMYFMVTKKGMEACRWEKIGIKLREKRIRRERLDHNQCLDEMAKLMDGGAVKSVAKPMVNPELAELERQADKLISNSRYETDSKEAEIMVQRALKIKAEIKKKCESGKVKKLES